MLGNLKEKAASKLGNIAPLDMILDFIKKSPAPVKVGDIVEKTGLDKGIVDKAITALKKDGRITSPERCKYTAT